MPSRSISSQPLPTFSQRGETGLGRERIHWEVRACTGTRKNQAWTIVQGNTSFERGHDFYIPLASPQHYFSNPPDVFPKGKPGWGRTNSLGGCSPCIDLGVTIQNGPEAAKSKINSESVNSYRIKLGAYSIYVQLNMSSLREPSHVFRIVKI